MQTPAFLSILAMQERERERDVELRLVTLYCVLLRDYRLISGKKKAHKHKLFGPVALGTPRECPRDKPGLSPVCPGDKPRFSSYFTQRKPSLSLGQTRFIPGTFRGRRAADRVYVLKVYVPFSFPIIFKDQRSGCLRVRLGERLGKPMGLDSEPFLKPIGRANSTRGQP